MSNPTDSSHVDVLVSGRTDQGRTRTDNQDTFLGLAFTESGPEGGVVLDPGEDGGSRANGKPLRLGPRGGLFLVADGMGGAAGGARASRLAVTEVAEAMRGDWAPAATETATGALARRLAEAVDRANRRIQEEARANPELEGMGTTLTGAAILGRTAVVAQVGDSRAYLLRGQQLRQLTRDQSVVQELVDAGAMSPEEARHSPRRNLILQALGTTPDLNVVFSETDLRQGDLLLLCSDGLCGVLEDDVLSTALREASDLEAACDTLVEHANDAGGPDNITVLLVRVAETRGDAPDDDAPDASTATRPFRLVSDVP